jgi:5-methyltetrahydrofolate--homocysteine methyltransferase
MLIDLLKKKMLVLDLPLAEWLPMKGVVEATPAKWATEELSTFCAQAIQAQLAAGVDLLTIHLPPIPTDSQNFPDYIPQMLRGGVHFLRSLTPLKPINVVLPAAGFAIQPFGDQDFNSAVQFYTKLLRCIAEYSPELLTLTAFSNLQDLRALLIAAREVLPQQALCLHWNDLNLVEAADFANYLLVAESLAVRAVSFDGNLSACKIFIAKVRSISNLPVLIRLHCADSALMIKQTAELVRLGVNALGIGAPADVTQLKAVADLIQPAQPHWGQTNFPLRIASARHILSIGSRLPFIKIGERINPTGRKKLADQLRKGELGIILDDARAQVAAGADALDVNVGAPLVDEQALMRQALLSLQLAVEVPLVIDSASPEVIEAGLQVYAGKALVNSVNAKERRLQEILPLVKKYGSAVIALCIGETMPNTAEERLAFARQIIAACDAYQIDRSNILVDPAALAIASDENSGPAVLQAIYLIKEQLGLPLSVGASNTSFGLPDRARVHNTFIIQAMAMGLDAAILNPLDPEVHDLIAAASLFTGRDPYCRTYLKKFRQRQRSTA